MTNTSTGQVALFSVVTQVATLKSSCIVLFAHLLKIHPIELIEVS